MITVHTSETTASSRSPRFSEFRTFGTVVASAAHLPLLAVSDWATRAARAFNSGPGDHATAVSLVDTKTGATVHVGADCTPALAHLQATLFAHVASDPRDLRATTRNRARQIDWSNRSAHPFADAGFS